MASPIWLGILLSTVILYLGETQGAAAWTTTTTTDAHCGPQRWVLPSGSLPQLHCPHRHQRRGAAAAAFSTAWLYPTDFVATPRPLFANTVLYSGDPNTSEPEWSDFEDLGFVSGQRSSSSSNSPDSTQDSRPVPPPPMPYVPAPDDIVDSTKSNDQSPTQLPDNWAQLMSQQGVMDRTAIQVRRFSLGPDLILSNYVGNMGFDEVTDWEYYYPSSEDEDKYGDTSVRQVVQPSPFDTSTYVCVH
jgi:hypothetical protein